MAERRALILDAAGRAAELPDGDHLRGVQLAQVAIAPTTGTINLAWGNHYLVDASSLGTGGAILQLPAATVNGRLAITLLTDAPAVLGDEIIIKYDGGAEWSRLFMNGESVGFGATASVVFVAADDRRSAVAKINGVGGANYLIADSVYEFIGGSLLATVDTDIGAMVDVAAGIIYPRRSARLYISVYGRTVETMTGQFRVRVVDAITKAPLVTTADPPSAGFNGTANIADFINYDIATDGGIELSVRQRYGGAAINLFAGSATGFSVVEMPS